MRTRVESFTNTTVGGRDLPALNLPSIALWGVYPESSPVCQHEFLLASRKLDHGCVLRVGLIMSEPAASSKFTDPVPNGQAISFNGHSWHQSNPEGYAVQGAYSEEMSQKAVDALNQPIGFGVTSATILGSKPVNVDGLANCRMTSQGVSHDIKILPGFEFTGC